VKKEEHKVDAKNETHSSEQNESKKDENKTALQAGHNSEIKKRRSN